MMNGILFSLHNKFNKTLQLKMKFVLVHVWEDDLGKLPVCVFENFEIARVKRVQFQNFQKQ